MPSAIKALQECVDYAAAKGIFVGVENHGKLTPEQVLQIIAGVKSEWFGVNLDSGNFVSDSPYEDLALCAPFAVNVQLKHTMKRPSGETYKSDWNRVAEILKKVKYRGYVVLEFEDAEPFKHVPDLMKSLREHF